MIRPEAGPFAHFCKTRKCCRPLPTSQSLIHLAQVMGQGWLLASTAFPPHRLLSSFIFFLHISQTCPPSKSYKMSELAITDVHHAVLSLPSCRASFFAESITHTPHTVHDRIPMHNCLLPLLCKCEGARHLCGVSGAGNQQRPCLLSKTSKNRSLFPSNALPRLFCFPNLLSVLSTSVSGHIQAVSPLRKAGRERDSERRDELALPLVMRSRWSHEPTCSLVAFLFHFLQNISL